MGLTQIQHSGWEYTSTQVSVLGIQEPFIGEGVKVREQSTPAGVSKLAGTRQDMNDSGSSGTGGTTIRSRALVVWIEVM